MSFDYKHNLDGFIDPESLKYLFNQIAKSGMEDDLVNAPFIRVEYKGSDRFISFWSPKDTLAPGESEVDMGMSYCRHFLRSQAQ